MYSKWKKYTRVEKFRLIDTRTHTHVYNHARIQLRHFQEQLFDYIWSVIAKQ